MVLKGSAGECPVQSARQPPGTESSEIFCPLSTALCP